ncbi:fumarate reductase flavoprotein subunit [Pantoea agglomerans]|uniref:Fumarate reductase flavoprotein subunit n=1 Tax=Enterobacter agglomerans TaxID=549 RepID=A0A379LTL8_ENTAG|nr:fumarate reductase flavoprotein subunit [Pantoea agglomerans]
MKLNMSEHHTLEATLARYNNFVIMQKDEDFGRQTALRHPLSEAPFYAIRVAPGVHTPWAASPLTPPPRCWTARNR